MIYFENILTTVRSLQYDENNLGTRFLSTRLFVTRTSAGFFLRAHLGNGCLTLMIPAPPGGTEG